MNYNLILQIYIFILSIGLNTGADETLSHWTYPEDANWPQTCHGSKQSPIDLTRNNTYIIRDELYKFGFHNYDNIITTTCVNDGHTVKFIIDPHNEVTLTGGGLKDEYLLTQIHFHWKSEHTLNNKNMPLECHFVHTSMAQPSNRQIRDASVTDDMDIHVLGVFYEISGGDNSKPNSLINSLRNVATAGSSRNVQIKPSDLLPENVKLFFRYKGSLTTPPCYEIVTWTVFAEPVLLSNSQYEQFSLIKSFDGVHKSNYRNVQALNGRNIKLYTNSSVTIYATNFLLLLAGAVLLSKYVQYS